MIMDSYIKQFMDYLRKERNYPECKIRSNTYKYDGKEYGRVEVMSEEYVIQAFVLMSPEQCKIQDKHKFPFYRTYNQWSDSGYLTPPACNVAVYYQDKWEIHSASDLKVELTSPNFLNYDAAVKRFNKRLGYVGNKKLRRVFKRLSIAYIIIVGLYIAAYAMSINGLLGDVKIPLNSEVIALLILIMVLLLLPPLIPYVKSITIRGLDIDLIQD